MEWNREIDQKYFRKMIKWLNSTFFMVLEQVVNDYETLPSIYKAENEMCWTPFIKKESGSTCESLDNQ